MPGPFRLSVQAEWPCVSPRARADRPLERELAFTETYRACAGEHIAVREAKCLRLGRKFHPLAEGDLFAGRRLKAALDPDGLLVGFGLEHEDCGSFYYCEFERMRQAIEEMDSSPGYRRRCEQMLAFWEQEDTTRRYVRALPEQVRHATRENRLSGKGIRLAGALIDFDRLIRLGVPGLIRAAEERWQSARDGDGLDPEFFCGMRMALDVLVDLCCHYAVEARRLADSAGNAGRTEELRLMADDLEHLTTSPPQTLRQGLQLFWLYAGLAGMTNYGRMDEYLGDLYVADLEAGRLTRAEALRLLLGMWQLIAEARFHFNSRIIVGGRGRRNPACADRFALLAMEASRLSATTEPQLSLRFGDEQDPHLLNFALDCIADGGVYPILYNDDVNIPAVANAFGVSHQEAEHYLPYGCGEYALNHRSVGSPNTGFNLLKCVQVVMHNGVDPDTAKPTGLETGDFTTFATFEHVWEAYTRQVEYHMAQVARAHAVEYEIERTTASFLLCSLLYDECMERGRSLVDGGARYRGAVVESMALVNAADCLSAIRQLVYEQKRFSPGQLLAMLEADWQGYERERQLFLNAPKYGNDDAEADQMLCRVSEHACRAAIEQAKRVGFDYNLLVCINNFAHMTIGSQTGATPDGRAAGQPIANGNGPTAGFDRSGVTAFLNSIVKPDPRMHAGYVHNMKFSKRMFRRSRPKLRALLNAYFASGGTQAMITCVGREDLENAMREPEDYRNLMVRVGGFCARFVDLAEELQHDIIKRTFYG